MKKVKLIHLISSLEIGGAEMLLEQLIPELALYGYQQEVIYFKDGPLRPLLEAYAIPVHKVEGRFCPYDPIFFVRLIRLLLSSKPCVIHASLWAASFFGRLVALFCRIPIICVVHTEPAHTGAFRMKCDRLIACLSQPMIAVSQPIATSLVREKLAKEQKVTVIPNGINHELFATRATQQRMERASLGYTQTDFIIGSVGRLIPVKNYTLLLKVFALLALEHQHIKLIIVGSGPQEAHLRLLAAAFGLNNRVQFVTDNAFAYGYYQLFDCFTLPSLMEGLSLALLEAMSAARVCIVTAPPTGTHPVILDGYNGLVIAPDNFKALFSALKKIITVPELRSKMALNACSDAKERFNIKIMAERYHRIFQQHV